MRQNQQPDVMAAVQRMRAKAQAAGTLQSNSQIQMIQQSPSTIVIQPTNPQVVYVPQYNPSVVYGVPYVVPAFTPPVAVAAFGGGMSFDANGYYHPDPGYHPGTDTHYGPNGGYHPNGCEGRARHQMVELVSAAFGIFSFRNGARLTLHQKPIASKSLVASLAVRVARCDQR